MVSENSLIPDPLDLDRVHGGIAHPADELDVKETVGTLSTGTAYAAGRPGSSANQRAVPGTGCLSVPATGPSKGFFASPNASP